MKLRNRKLVVKNEQKQKVLSKTQKDSPKKFDEEIEKTYIDTKSTGSLGGIRKTYKALKQKNRNITFSDVKNYLSTQDEYSLHKPIVKKFERNKVLVSGIDDIWQIDLIDMRAFKKENKNINYILTVIDVFSKYAWGRMVKNKEAKTVMEAMKSVINSSKRKPKKIHADDGNEFKGEFKKYTNLLGIKLYLTNTGLKASVVERFNRSIKEKIWRYFTAYRETSYYDHFDKFFESYNSSYHRSIKMPPKEVNLKNSVKVFFNLYGYDKNIGSFKEIDIKFKMGDYVRITKYKSIFSKGYERNWNNEVFQIDKILLNNALPMYELIDLTNQKVKQKFYSQELQLVSINIREMEKKNVFHYDQILDTRVVKGKKEFLVRWRYYPDSLNSWVKEKDLEG
jgi:hypothetical protein